MYEVSEINVLPQVKGGDASSGLVTVKVDPRSTAQPLKFS